jgi:general secretion pathway protein G
MRASRTRRRGGLTLIEVMLVLVILVIIGSLVVVNVIPMGEKARMRAAKIQVSAFESAIKNYHLDVQNYPTTDQGLQALVQPPAGLVNPDKWGPEPYLEKAVPLDPWDRPYQYQYPGKYNPTGFDIWSLGPDGQDGTADDIGNWEQG